MTQLNSSDGAAPSYTIVGVAREGWPIIAGFVALAVAASLGALWASVWAGLVVGVLGAVLCGWCVWFFRDPQRTPPPGEGLVVSPADGVVCLVDRAAPPAEVGLGAGPLDRVCVFMNVFNVHVNRSPVAGRVRRIAYRAGKFLNASLDKASEANERSAMVVEMGDGRCVVAVQIAGLVARRIVSRVGEGATLARGERYGLIRFGSRVDVYVPEGTRVRVRVGERMVAGESVLGELAPSGAPVRAPQEVAS